MQGLYSSCCRIIIILEVQNPAFARDISCCMSKKMSLLHSVSFFDVCYTAVSRKILTTEKNVFVFGHIQNTKMCPKCHICPPRTNRSKMTKLKFLWALNPLLIMLYLPVCHMIGCTAWFLQKPQTLLRDSIL